MTKKISSIENMTNEERLEEQGLFRLGKIVGEYDNSCQICEGCPKEDDDRLDNFFCVYKG